MFGRKNVFATLSKFAGIRVKDEREQDRNHLVEIEFEAPLTFDLAADLSPALARDLYDADGGEMVPKQEIADLSPCLNLGRQIMTVRPHPDLDPLGRLPGVEIRRLRVSKADAGTWTLTWLTMFPFEERTVIGLIRHLKLGVYLTFELEAPALDFEGTDGKAAGAGEFAQERQADLQEMPADAPRDNVTPITASKRGRGRPKGSGKRRTPEATKADQIADAKSRPADEDGDPAGA
jgi:hypothetical protein